MQFLTSYLRASWAVWFARGAILTVILLAPWSAGAAAWLLLAVILLDAVWACRAGRLGTAGALQAEWRAGTQDGFLPSAAEVVSVKPAFEVPVQFENDPASPSAPVAP